jgi:hypothetical protein
VLGVIAVHLLVGLVESWHDHLLDVDTTKHKLSRGRPFPVRVRHFLKDMVYVATSRGGIKFLAGFMLVISARLIGLIVSNIATWEAIALVAFVTTIYVFLDGMESLWRNRHVKDSN